KKIYARVQKINNLDFIRREGGIEEMVAHATKEKRTLDVVLRDGAGYRDELVHVFVALSRGAGLPAFVMRVADRDEYFFQPNIPNPNQLTSEIAIVSLNGKDVFLDPGTPMCPYGLLVWQHTSSKGLRQSPGGGTELAQTDAPAYRDAVS